LPRNFDHGQAGDSVDTTVEDGFRSPVVISPNEEWGADHVMRSFVKGLVITGRGAALRPDEASSHQASQGSIASESATFD